MLEISEFIGVCGFQNVRRKADGNYNFRCTICGDSQKSKTKKRAWLLYSKKTSQWMYYCFNCGASLSFISYLKQYHFHEYTKFINSVFKRKKTDKQDVYSQSESIINKSEYVVMDLPSISQLDKEHEAYQYILERKLPEESFKYLFYADRFKQWINTKIPDKFENIDHDEGRIIIPFFNQEKKLFGIAGRSLDINAYLRYITIRFNETEPKLFGLDSVNLKEPIYVLEGQLDSLFIPNGIALCGGDISFDELIKIAPKENFIMIYDNEINQDTFKRIDKAIKAGFKISLLPKEWRKYGKDINDYIKKGLTKEQIYDNIQKNICSGLKAKIILASWKKRE